MEDLRPAAGRAPAELVHVTPRPVRCHHGDIADQAVTGQLSTEEYQALRLHAVLDGSSVQSVVEADVQAELAQQLAARPGRSRKKLVAEMLARVGIDPAGVEDLCRSDEGAPERPLHQL